MSEKGSKNEVLRKIAILAKREKVPGHKDSFSEKWEKIGSAGHDTWAKWDN